MDFMNLDNAKAIFDEAQLSWAMKVIAADETDPSVKVLLVGMHASLPDSYTFDHSMNQGSDKGESGRVLYKRLLEFRQKTGKPVHVFSSHSHYYLADIYNTGAWQSNGGVLPGWLVGTAGAQHYSIPPEVKSFTTWAENEYGYELVRELELYVKGGLTPAEALSTATISPARNVKADSRTGSIKVGKEADLLLVDGDPEKNIGDLRHVYQVMSDGYLMDGNALRKAAGYTGMPK